MGEVRVIKTADFRKEEKCTLKKERIYRKEYGTIGDVKKDMFRYIELFYNNLILHKNHKINNDILRKDYEK